MDFALRRLVAGDMVAARIIHSAVALAAGALTIVAVMAGADKQPTRPLTWQPIPQDASLHIAWPTPNRSLRADPDSFFARTPANPDYGKPGWTRDCGNTLHRGCDIAPVDRKSTGKTTTVMFTDCASGKEYPGEEPSWIPQDAVYAIADGRVAEAVDDPDISTFGNHVVIEHRWPQSGDRFFSVYAHLAGVAVTEAEKVTAGQEIGRMGQTSKSADARNWMAIAPHLHLEVWNARGQHFDPVEFLQRFIPPEP